MAFDRLKNSRPKIQPFRIPQKSQTPETGLCTKWQVSTFRRLSIGNNEQIWKNNRLRMIALGLCLYSECQRVKRLDDQSEKQMASCRYPKHPRNMLFQPSGLNKSTYGPTDQRRISWYHSIQILFWIVVVWSFANFESQNLQSGVDW